MPPPAPKLETWTFNGKIYNSYNDYLEAKATYEAEQRRKQEEQNKRLQREIKSLRSARGTVSDDKEESSVAGAISAEDIPNDSGLVVGTLIMLVLLAGGGGYFLSKRKISK